jgi:L-asparaginase
MMIKVFVTGGTFDKEYNEIKGELFFKDTHLPEMLDMGRCRISVDIRTLMMIDSLDMTEEDRKIILENCKNVKENQILITHGTDTMIETAKLLASSINDKTVVLTGAMIPYKFGSSDGLFNLGSALAFVQTLPKGVYIVMNGKYFLWDKVRKNKYLGEFEEIESDLI